MAGVSAGVLSASLDHGVRLGRALVSWIAADGFAGTERAYSPPVGDSLWRSSPPNFGAAIAPYWSEVRPMVLYMPGNAFPEADAGLAAVRPVSA